MEVKQPREKSAQEALEALMARCARAEVCIADARRLMQRWRVPPSDQEQVIDRLIRERFIDEERYAEAFVRDKLNFSRWGGRKISEALYQKRIPAAIIRQAMMQVDEEFLRERLEADLLKKRRSIREDDPFKLRDKLIRFGLSRGFNAETVFESVQKIMGAAE